MGSPLLEMLMRNSERLIKIAMHFNTKLNGLTRSSRKEHDQLRQPRLYSVRHLRKASITLLGGIATPSSTIGSNSATECPLPARQRPYQSSLIAVLSMALPDPKPTYGLVQSGRSTNQESP